MFLDFLLVMTTLTCGMAILGFIVLSVMRGIFKKGPPFKTIGIITGIPFLALFIVSLIISSYVEPTEQAPTTPKSEATAKDVKEKVENDKPIEEKTFTPQFKVAGEVIDNQVKISGETNLPDETALLIVLKDNKDKEIDKLVSVKNGKFFLDPMPIEELKPGEQSIKIDLSDDQPDSVTEVIGKNGNLLTGEFINDEKELIVSTNIDVPKERAPPSDVKADKVKVTRVVDGDTIKVNINGKEETIRLILVDTPETKHPQMGVQPFGPEATEFTTKTLEGKEVYLELGVQERDKYGRILAYVWIGDKLFNNMLLEKGLARVAVYPPNTKYLDELEATQAKAKKKAEGIWSIENYVQEDGFKEPKKEKSVAVSPKKETKESSLKKVENKSEAKPKEQTVKKEQKNTAEAKPAPTTKSDPPAQGECNIKGSQNGIYHVPGSTYYNRTKNVAQWFCSVEEAENAGYRPPKR